MWTRVQTNDDIKDGVEVMKQMDRNYAALTVDVVRSYEINRKMYGYIYRKDDVRIVLAMEPFASGTRIRVYTAGFTGAISPEKAADLAVRQLIAVMREQKAYAIITCMRNVDHEPLNQAFDAVKSHSRMRVRVLSDNGKFRLLEATAVDCSDKSCIWEWTGTQWAQTSDDCKSGCTCQAPSYEGTYLGETEVTLCESAGS